MYALIFLTVLLIFALIRDWISGAIVCNSCGTKCKKNSEFCRKCGKKIEKKKVITKEEIEKQLKKENVKNPRSNGGCFLVVGLLLAVGGLLFLFPFFSGAFDVNIPSIIGGGIPTFAAFLIGCWIIYRSIKSFQFAKRQKALLQNGYRIVKSNCVKIETSREAQIEGGPDYYHYRCCLENGEIVFVSRDEISQEKNGDPVEIGTPVYLVYINGDIPLHDLYFSGKEYEMSPDLIIEE